MTINSPRQLKDWINNRAKKEGLIANTLLQSFIYLKSISESPELEKIWDDYRKKYSYAENIEFVQIITTIKELLAEF